MRGSLIALQSAPEIDRRVAMLAAPRRHAAGARKSFRKFPFLPRNYPEAPHPHPALLGEVTRQLDEGQGDSSARTGRSWVWRQPQFNPSCWRVEADTPFYPGKDRMPTFPRPPPLRTSPNFVVRGCKVALGRGRTRAGSGADLHASPQRPNPGPTLQLPPRPPSTDPSPRGKPGRR